MRKTTWCVSALWRRATAFFVPLLVSSNIGWELRSHDKSIQLFIARQSVRWIWRTASEYSPATSRWQIVRGHRWPTLREDFPFARAREGSVATVIRCKFTGAYSEILGSPGSFT